MLCSAPSAFESPPGMRWVFCFSRIVGLRHECAELVITREAETQLRTIFHLNFGGSYPSSEPYAEHPRNCCIAADVVAAAEHTIDHCCYYTRLQRQQDAGSSYQVVRACLSRQHYFPPRRAKRSTRPAVAKGTRESLAPLGLEQQLMA
jgi:hypothetical protein